MPDLLTARAVSVRHGRRPAVDDVSVRLRHGEVLAVVGPNGSGKTSLARVLAGLARPSAGQVLLEGGDLADVPTATRARRIAYVGQDEHGDIPFTARDVVLLGRSVWRRDWQGYTPDDHDRVDALLADLELDVLASRRMDAMSGGERQRVLLARALAQDASLVVLDEPTNHLDVRFCHLLLQRLRLTAESSATGVVVVLHDLDLAATYADRIAVLHAGRLVAGGPPEQALEPAAISRVYRTPARLLPDGAGRRLVFGPQREGGRPLRVM